MTTKSGGKQARPKKLLNNKIDPVVGKATQFKKGQSGNPAGKPKGTISLSTRIQRLMNDEEFMTWIPDRRDGWREYKGAPAEAIINALMLRAIAGDIRAADWLAKYGWGTKVEVSGPEGGPVKTLVEFIDGPTNPDTR